MIEIPINKISETSNLDFIFDDILKKYCMMLKDLKIKNEDNIINILNQFHKEMVHAGHIINA